MKPSTTQAALDQDFGPVTKPSAAFLTAEQLAKELNFPSAVTVRNLARQRKIPQLRVGFRTRLFELSKVKAALQKLEIKAV